MAKYFELIHVLSILAIISIKTCWYRERMSRTIRFAISGCHWIMAKYFETIHVIAFIKSGLYRENMLRRNRFMVNGEWTNGPNILQLLHILKILPTVQNCLVQRENVEKEKVEAYCSRCCQSLTAKYLKIVACFDDISHSTYSTGWYKQRAFRTVGLVLVGLFLSRTYLQKLFKLDHV